MPDIDIDFDDRNKALDILDHVVASRVDNNQIIKHNTGVYLHEAPVNAVTGTCAIPYSEAENLGYFKIDFLNVGIYKDVKSEQHLNNLLNKEPLWELLENPEFVDMLFHINGHSSILQQTKPKNVEQLAAVLAMIRPAKRYLIGKPWNEIMKEVWVKPLGDEYYFKKSHSLAYAFAIIVHMNLLCEQLESN